MKNDKNILGDMYAQIDRLKQACDKTFHGHDGNELINEEATEFYGSVKDLKQVMHIAYDLFQLKTFLDEDDEEEKQMKEKHIKLYTKLLVGRQVEIVKRGKVVKTSQILAVGPYWDLTLVDGQHLVLDDMLDDLCDGEARVSEEEDIIIRLV